MWVLLMVFFSCFQMVFYFVTTGWIFEMGLFIRIVASQKSPRRLHTSLVTVQPCGVSFRGFWGCCRKYSLIGFFKARRRSIILNWLIHLFMETCFARKDVMEHSGIANEHQRQHRLLG